MRPERGSRGGPGTQHSREMLAPAVGGQESLRCTAGALERTQDPGQPARGRRRAAVKQPNGSFAVHVPPGPGKPRWNKGLRSRGEWVTRLRVCEALRHAACCGGGVLGREPHRDAACYRCHSALLSAVLWPVPGLPSGAGSLCALLCPPTKNIIAARRRLAHRPRPPAPQATMAGAAGPVGRLLKAADKGDEDTLKRMLQSGTDANAWDAVSRRPTGVQTCLVAAAKMAPARSACPHPRAVAPHAHRS